MAGAFGHCPRITNDELPLLPPREERAGERRELRIG